MLTIVLPRRRKRGRLETMFIDVVKEDIQRVGVTEKDARDRVRWS